MYSVSSPNVSYYVFMYIHLYVTCTHDLWIFFISLFSKNLLRLAILLSTIRIKFNPLKEHHKEFQKQCPQFSTKKRVILYLGFTKQLVIVDINLIPTFVEEIKHHWGSFWCMKCYTKILIVLRSITLM